MRSILFIMNYSVDHKSRRKYRDQMNAVKRLGCDVWYIGHDGRTIYLCHGDEKTAIGKVRCSLPLLPEENQLYISIYRSIREALKIKQDFTYCYVRRFIFEPAAADMLRLMHRSGIKTIVEIPTYPHHKEMLLQNTLKSRMLVAMDDLYAKKSAPSIDLFCPMGEEVKTLYGRPSLNIENGIDVSDIRLRVPVYQEKEYHIAALAVMTPWHGYDRLIRGLADYYAVPDREDKIYLHLIGTGNVLEEWRQLAEKLGISEYVLFEGKMDNEQMNEAFDRYDMGAASLARYRSGLSVVYELKTREYMARGIPFLYATEDRAIEQFGKYALKVPNDDSPISMEGLLDFMKEMRGCPVAGQEMREYAARELTFEKQFRKIFDFLDAEKRCEEI